jgi:hypothetical protein
LDVHAPLVVYIDGFLLPRRRVSNVELHVLSCEAEVNPFEGEERERGEERRKRLAVV